MKNRMLPLARAKARRKKIFCAFLTLGYPSLAKTEALVKDFEKAGVDILELGFPFSDPMADGPTIQFSSEEALKHGVRLEDAFELVRKLRKDKVSLPIIFFSYYNPIFSQGTKTFLKKAKSAGFDGVIIPDLPPDAEADFHRQAARAGLAEIFLVTPTTSPERSLRIAKQSRGFIYYVSLKGVTGARKSLPADIRGHVTKIRRKEKKPVLIGFGVSGPEQAKSLAAFSDGVIVGSAIIDAIRHSGGRTEPATVLVAKMIRAIRS
ncbi:MAG TPA: tryptophan synthase subunit alpha [Verrucomicrobiae bacterium]|jgi:tryptophan synthase alpha chain|nr:tryptophan synthase subunit alpha [Verrucomicrobiae bacterium]